MDLFRGCIHGINKSLKNDQLVIDETKEYFTLQASNNNRIKFDKYNIGYLDNSFPENYVKLLNFASKNYPSAHMQSFQEESIHGMLKTLDPHSSYMTPDQLNELMVETKGELLGIGVVISITDGVPTVVSPIDDSPAFKKGIKAGDKIIMINKAPTKDIPLMDIVKEIRGPKGTEVLITVQRSGWSVPKEIKITRDRIPLISVKSKLLEPGYTCIRIVNFSSNTRDDFKKDLEKLARGKTTKGLIVDIRNNPGGLLDQVRETADIFIDDGILVSTQSRIKEQNMTYRANPGDTEYAFPVIVLVNEGTASGSEIFAAALQEHKKAMIIGTKTFGKGTVSTIIRLENGGALRLTTAQYVTPLGNKIQGRGVLPDLVTVLPDRGKEKHLREKDLENTIQAESDRPDTKSLSITLDSRTEDPVLDLAVAIMKKTPSGRFTDLLASARQIAFEKQDKRVARQDAKDVHTPTQSDTTPPSISITEPVVKRGVVMKHKEKTILVKGKAVDAAGVFEVLVNGRDASLAEDGRFLAEAKLAVGENSIRIQATDINDNTAFYNFVIQREVKQRTSLGSLKPTPEEDTIWAGKYFALLIGVEDYQSSTITGLDQPLKDAGQVMDVLRNNYTFDADNIIFLKNPSREIIIDTFDQLSRKITEHDNLLIFYAGHGYWDNSLKQGYWLPSNASRNSRSNWLSNSTIRDYVRGINSKHTLLVSDACFSGGIFKTRKAFNDIPSATNELYKLPSRKAMTSGTLTEVPDRSVFVKYFVKRLQENTDNYLSSEQLFARFKEAVINNSPLRQVPQFGEIREGGDEGGDFIFIRRGVH
ncbi:MAG: caspase family protein [Desulfobulbaceae bacterium]|nr:caspase family protein [Desulfobulbaceae bacterium]